MNNRETLTEYYERLRREDPAKADRIQKLDRETLRDWAAYLRKEQRRRKRYGY